MNYCAEWAEQMSYWSHGRQECQKRLSVTTAPIGSRERNLLALSALIFFCVIVHKKMCEKIFFNRICRKFKTLMSIENAQKAVKMFCI